MTTQMFKSIIDRDARLASAGEALLPPGAELGRRANLVVRLASGDTDIEAAQHLRYRVFYGEMGAQPDARMALVKRDIDAFDDICDHLLVVAAPGTGDGVDPVHVRDGELVGTYRLLRQDVAERNWGFYTADEFDIGPLLEARGDELNFLELGRSCVTRPYRTKPVIELLWPAIWNYVRVHRLDVMLGCASLAGTDPDALAAQLTFIHENFRAPAPWRVPALPERCVPMNRLPAGEIDARAVMRSLPPLIKGYLRLGAYIGDGAVIDHQFGTTDILIVLPVSAINARYFSHFGAPDAALGELVGN